jgi:RND family efflux transporter MFP subunit
MHVARPLVALIATAVIVVIGAPVVTGRSPDALWATVTSAFSGLLENTARPPGQASQASTPAVAPATPPPSVTVSQPLRREIVEWDEVTGRFEAQETVDLRARVSGYLQDVMFKDGQDVAKGDTLFLIDQRPYERALAQAKAELEQARTKIGNASLDVERGRALLGRKILSEKTFDDRESLQRDAEALARIAEEKVKTAELDLSFTRITAPVSGRIGRALVTPGNYVTAGGSTGTSTLATIVSQDPIYLYFDVAESDMLKYKRMVTEGSASAARLGTRVEVALPDETGFPHVGQIDFLDNRLDAGTASLRVRAMLPNDKRIFTPGQFARARLQGSKAYTATLVPDSAIGADQVNRFVVVVGPDELPVRRTVKLGPLVDGLRVVRDGLNADEWIVTKGLTRVRPGQKIAPNREPLKVSQGAPATGATARP